MGFFVSCEPFENQWMKAEPVYKEAGYTFTPLRRSFTSPFFYDVPLHPCLPFLDLQTPFRVSLPFLYLRPPLLTSFPNLFPCISILLLPPFLFLSHCFLSFIPQSFPSSSNPIFLVSLLFSIIYAFYFAICSLPHFFLLYMSYLSVIFIVYCWFTELIE